MSNSKYTREFKDSTVQLVLNSEDSALKIAKDLGLNDQTLYNLSTAELVSHIC